MSGDHYLKSFIFPLLEETRTDLCSSIKIVSEAPACQITDIDFAEDYNPPYDLLYNIEMETIVNSDKKGDTYEPETGDLIALTDIRPTCIYDLDKPGNSYFICLIRRVKQDLEDKNVYKVQILASKPTKFEVYLQKDDRCIHGFAVSLSNITTNIRIWNALNSEPDGPSMYIIRKLLNPNSEVRTVVDSLSL